MAHHFEVIGDYCSVWTLLRATHAVQLRLIGKRV